MAALDFEPDNRLVAAKGVISDFIEERKYDRVGLVVFASEAFIHSPPTIDHRVLKFMLDDVELAGELRIEDGTAIGLGMAAAANMLKESDSKSRVIVLLTDGRNNRGAIDPLTAALAAKALGIKVYTIGMVRPEGSLTTRGARNFGPFNIDEDILQEIAVTTGGYTSAPPTPWDCSRSMTRSARWRSPRWSWFDSRDFASWQSGSWRRSRFCSFWDWWPAAPASGGCHEHPRAETLKC